MVQRRAARLVTGRYRNTSSVTKQICWTTLDGRPMNPEEQNFYKIVNDLIAIPHSKYLIPASKKTRAAHSFKYQHYPRSTDCYKFSFFPRTITAWNRLPAVSDEAPSLVSLKREFGEPCLLMWIPLGHEVNLNDDC